MPTNTGLESMFTGGAVKFDTEPSVNFYAQLMAHQQAKRDALDQYYQKVLSDTTPTGMRTQDIQNGWSQKLNNLQEFALNPQNRKYLENPKLDNYATTTQFNKMHTDLLNDTQLSKNAHEQDLKADQLRLNKSWHPTGKLEDPNNLDSWTPNSDMDIFNRNSMSIYDPKRGNPNINNISYNKPAFSPLQEEQLFNSAFQNIKPKPITDTSKKPRVDSQGYVYTPTITKFRDDQIKQGVMQYAAFAKGTEKENQAENLLYDPNFYPQANAAYKSIFPNDNIGNDTQKMLMAMGIMKARNVATEGEQKEFGLAAKMSLANAREKAQGIDPATILADTRQTVDNIISHKDQQGNVTLTPAMYKSIYGREMTSNSVVKVDNDGNFIFGKKDIDNPQNIKWDNTPVDYGTVLQKTANLQKPNTSKIGNVTNLKPGVKQPKTKTVSLNTLKSLIGTKGYEGYNLDELKQYYISNGYNIK